MSSNQDEGMKQDQAELNIALDDNHNHNDTMITWDYKRANIKYFQGYKEGKYHVDII